MKKRLNKKGFTIIELVIVVAVIAILSAVLIPTFSRVVRNAKTSADTTLVRNLNTMLKSNTEGHETMQDALDTVAAEGYDVAKISTKAEDSQIVWDSVNDCFVYVDDEGQLKYIPNSKTVDEVADYQLWAIDNEVDENSPYSTYLYDYNGTGTVNTSKGIDVGNEKNVTTINYTNTGAAQNTVIRMHGGELNVNAPNDDIKYYGEAEFVNVTAVAENSFHVFGKVDMISVTAGKVQLEKKATVQAVHAEGAAKLVVVSGATVEKITEKTAGALTVTGTTQAKEVKTLDEVKNETVSYAIKDVASLKAFIAGDKVKGKLLASFEVNEVINVSRKLELNLNGYTITNTLKAGRPFFLKTGANVTVDGTVAGSSIHTIATAGSYGAFRLAENNTRLVINGGTYPTTTDNGAFVRVAKDAKNTYAEFNNIVVKNDGGLIYSAENTTSAADNNVLNVTGGSFEHGYAVDQREGASTYGIRCSAFTVAAGVFTNVKINSQFSTAIETTLGEVTLNNCQFSVVSSIDDGNPFSNAAICASYGSKLTLNGGSFSGLYGLALTPSGQTVINNGATITGRTSVLLTYALSGSATRNTTGLEGLTNTNV